MKLNDATETAYKNGYAAGAADGMPRADEDNAMYLPHDEELADRLLFVHNLGWLLSQTREEVVSVESVNGETAVITYRSGFTRDVCISCDSYAAIIRDVARSL